jgi:hypothetical protein
MNELKPRPTFQVLIMSEESRPGREAIETACALKHREIHLPPRHGRHTRKGHGETHRDEALELRGEGSLLGLFSKVIPSL